jgi:hypothetical protein
MGSLQIAQPIFLHDLNEFLFLAQPVSNPWVESSSIKAGFVFFQAAAYLTISCQPCQSC